MYESMSDWFQITTSIELLEYVSERLSFLLLHATQWMYMWLFYVTCNPSLLADEQFNILYVYFLYLGFR